MRRNIFLRPLGLFLLIACMLLAGCSDGDGVVDDVVEVTTTDRPWVMEEEFQQNPSLRATLDQIIILNLEPVPQGGDISLRRNTIPYLVQDMDRGPLSFNIPAEEPYIVALELETSAGETVMRTERGEDCAPVTLPAGQYRMNMFHDGSAIAPPGKKAFLHHPGAPRLLGGSIAAPPADFLAIRGPNNKFVTQVNTTIEYFVYLLQSNASVVDMHTAFHVLWGFQPTETEINFEGIAPGDTGPPDVLWNGPAVNTFDGSPWWDFCEPPIMFTGLSKDCPDAMGSYIWTDLGNYQFRMPSQFSLSQGSEQPWVYGAVEMESDGITLTWTENATGAIFTADYKGFDCTSPCDASVLPLVEGEVALFSKPNFVGPAVVFIKDVPDLSIYDGAATAALALGDDTVASVRVGPNTLAVLYKDAQFGGDVLAFTEDAPSLEGTALSGATSSVQTTLTAKELIAKTDACNNCNLTGVDLSDEDMRNGSFDGTVFSEADLSGADFTGADLKCAGFSNTDLSSTTFGNNAFTTNFSCLLDLTRATLDVKTFEAANWRYFNLTGATFLNAAGATLSTVAKPLDLTGAILNDVTGLSGVILDGADMGCRSSTICTQAQQIDLTKASLQQATLKSADLRGAILEFANLEEADLESALLLEPAPGQGAASLSGAYLKNANLENADLSGVNLSNANFYGTEANATNATMSSANFTGAYLSGADFSGAVLYGADFTQAVLVGASLVGAEIGADAVTGATTTFHGAFLQGADFTNVTATNTDFESAYVDLTGSGILTFQIPQANLEFSGFWNSDPECVQFSYNSSTTIPESTDDTTNCPDANAGPCDTQAQCENQEDELLERWECPTIPMDQSQPPSSNDFPTTPAGECNSDTQLDFKW